MELDAPEPVDKVRPRAIVVDLGDVIHITPLLQQCMKETFQQFLDKYTERIGAAPIVLQDEEFRGPPTAV